MTKSTPRYEPLLLSLAAGEVGVDVTVVDYRGGPISDTQRAKLRTALDQMVQVVNLRAGRPTGHDD